MSVFFDADRKNKRINPHFRRFGKQAIYFLEKFAKITTCKRGRKIAKTQIFPFNLAPLAILLLIDFWGQNA